MKKATRHALFWLSIYLVWTYMKSGGGVYYARFLVVNLLNVAIYMAAYYLLVRVQLPRLFDRGKMVLFALSLLGVSIVFYLIWRTFGVLWVDELRGIKGRMPYLSMVDFLTQTVQFYSPAMALMALEMYFEQGRVRAHALQLEKEKMATELKFLKAQLNPHFLFNTLNNLYSYVVNNSPKAPDMILRLSGILDYVLYKSQHETVPLQEEIATIQNFIELEKIRYGTRLRLECDFASSYASEVSPLLLLSMVENAFKHGASGDIDHPEVRIRIKETPGKIMCTVWNTKSSYQGELNDAYKEGIGLSNLKKQLMLAYPDLHQLEIIDGDASFEVKLTLKLKHE